MLSKSSGHELKELYAALETIHTVAAHEGVQLMGQVPSVLSNSTKPIVEAMDILDIHSDLRYGKLRDGTRGTTPDAQAVDLAKDIVDQLR